MNSPDAIERKLDGLDITRQKWAEEKASGAWEAAARRQGEREQLEKEAKEEKADASHE
jgi:hypothetical protein